MQQFDLVIVGGGMTGLALAAGLADTPLQIAIIEAAEQPPAWQPEKMEIRVSALSEASKQLLDKLGAWEEMLKLRVNPYQGMVVWDSEGTAEVAFNAREAGVKDLGYLVENSVTQLGLLEVVKQQANLHWFRGVKPVAMSEPVDGTGQRELTLSGGEKLQAGLMVAADGAHSWLRQQGDFATREWDYNHHALVTSVRTEKSHENAAWQRFHASGPLAFLPLNRDGDDHWCSIVWSTSPEQAAELLALDEKTFNQRLTSAFEGRLGKVLVSEERGVYPLRQRHAVDYVKPGLALMGDAAHTIHPLAGQGVNLGFLDVATLTQVVHQAAQKRQPLGSLSVLKAYQHKRKPDNLAMMALMESFKRLFATRALPVLLLRNLGMKMVNSQPWVKRQLIAQALGVRALAKP
ncbi:UbiH/UbiF/VisC/COQ6 family ubiquinone biosynthesis hydroxylase [Marinospirillum sp.]|uniref:UbiH/UbiF/VisC/COQ6 family ubiquinone biosynthesis hydroxylase n=1 Tax=Marinospirillum sp. TaxID=2183934 RepID=UPI00286FDDAD|nr:UbiH/UbiF/VisC/COQ6 family ubiquinone biosynthesis hydroxylase [Marinospirillum sp.]MDR9466900.1 UbiH/UbiF/VisC/COQ6 family ubiquinone biosynthesis hydroxylase [Marinospirillum sp.]